MYKLTKKNSVLAVEMHHDIIVAPLIKLYKLRNGDVNFQTPKISYSAQLLQRPADVLAGQCLQNTAKGCYV